MRKPTLDGMEVIILAFATILAMAASIVGQTPENSNNSTHLSVSQQPGPESPELTEARQLNAAAVRLYDEGKYEEALKPAKRALEIREKTLHSDDRLVLNAVRNLAAIQLALKNFKEAEPLYKRILAADEKALGVDSLRVAETLDALALLHYTKGDFERTESDYKRALAIREKSSGPGRNEVAQTLYNLAEFYQFQSQFAKARPLYQRLIAFDEKLMPGSDSIVREALGRYACLLRKMNKPDEARQLDAQARVVSAQDQDALEQALLEGGILNGKALRLEKPAYPAEARARGASGTVEVQVTISEEGKVIHACALTGPSLLWQVSEGSAYRSIFSPTLLNGKPVKVTGIIAYHFVRQ